MESVFIFLMGSFCLFCVQPSRGGPLLELQDDKHRYIWPRDVNIGAVLSIHEFDEDRACGDKLRGTSAAQHAEAIVYAIKQINRNPDLLPNVTLGFVIFDDCAKDTTALAQVIHFMPSDERKEVSCETKCRKKPDSADSAEIQNFYDVVGVLGAQSSKSSIMMANILNIFQLPQISHMSTSVLLSDKKRYKFFMRMVPPDSFQVTAIVELLAHFKWTYISTVYSEGSYGREAVKHLKQEAITHSICIAKSLEVSQTMTLTDFDQIVSSLRQQKKARVIVAFTDLEESKGLLAAVKRAGLSEEFLWIGSDGFGFSLDSMDDIKEVALGSLSLRTYASMVPDFHHYFESTGLWNNTKNPWLRDLPSCRHRNGPENLCHIQSGDYKRDPQVSVIIDIIYAFAIALDRLRRDNCPMAKDEALKICIKKNNYLEYLKRVNFTGNLGEISFDNNGDFRGRYKILNFQKSDSEYKQVDVGIWSALNKKLTINKSAILWNINTNSSNSSLPVSACGQECSVGEVYTYFKHTCCWECRPCNPNEITVLNSTKCQNCPIFEWPTKTRLSCKRIQEKHLNWHDPVSLLLTTVAFLGNGLCLVVIFIYLKHNRARLIKATSRELSYTMLFGVEMQYLIVFSLLNKPDNTSCYLNYIGFNLSFTIVYAPLITKTNRIYRIFENGKRTTRQPALISSASQMLIALVLISVQAIIIVGSMSTGTPRAALRMPVASERFVELLCTLPLQGLILSLAYNVILVIICSFYAFKTRTLPDNFNESRYIALCVYTTLVIWLAFIPTYFATSRAYYQVILLSLALLMNASVTLLSMYTPKLFALRMERKSALKNKTNSALCSLDGVSNAGINLQVTQKLTPSIQMDCCEVVPTETCDISFGGNTENSVDTDADDDVKK